MDEPKLNKIQKKHLRDTPAGRYYENKEKPGTGEVQSHPAEISERRRVDL